MRLLFLGDIVGRVACQAVCSQIPALISDFSLDFVVVNAENAAEGFGITPELADQLFSSGVDVITTGNHIGDNHRVFSYLAEEDRLLRPANYLPLGQTVGKGSGLFTARNGARLMVANVMGRVFMPHSVEDPFSTAAQLVECCLLREQADAIVFDFHAEATSEKQALAHFLDGRISVLVGTHTHVPTADCKILENGTGYISDLGMCGDYDSSLGLHKEEPLNRFLGKKKDRFTVAEGPVTICGVGVNICESSGLVEAIAPFRTGPHLEPATPYFWR